MKIIILNIILVLSGITAMTSISSAEPMKSKMSGKMLGKKSVFALKMAGRKTWEDHIT